MSALHTLSRRAALKLAGTVIVGTALMRTVSGHAAEKVRTWWTPTPQMDTLSCIHTRRSVRSYTDADVSDAQVQALLGAAMAAPSAGNEQPWEFIVIRNKETKIRIGSINSFAQFASQAPVCILVCGNLERDRHHGYWIEDVSAATQNLLLAAHALGLGAVWTGVYPHPDRVPAFRFLLGLPETVVPMALVVVGYPAEQVELVNRFDRMKVHTERWTG